MSGEITAIRFGCGLWGTPGFPHRGWTAIGIEDLGQPRGVCEACGTTIRYVHYLEHSDYPSSVGVGCICAGHLQGDLVAPREGEKKIRATIARRRRWLTRRWKRSARGNEYLNASGFNIVIYPRRGGWCGRLAGADSDFVQFIDRICETPEEAKLAALDILQEVKNNG